MLYSNFVQYNEIVDSITKAIADKSKLIICYINFYGLCLIVENRIFAESIKNAHLLFSDGIGIALAGKLLGNETIKGSFNWTDNVFRFLELCEKKNWTIFFLGSTDEVLKLAVINIKKKYPKLKLVGVSNGYEDLNNSTIKKINDSQPDILWVGLGTPQQENWINEHKEKLNVNVIQAVGDVFSEVAGVKIRGGWFVRKIYFEWLIRAMSNPKKYGKRYFLYGPKFILLIINLLIKKYAKNFITIFSLDSSSTISE